MTLRGANVVVLAGPGFEELEFWYPVLRSREGGANVTVLGVEGPEMCSGRSGYPVVPDADLATFDRRPDFVFVPGFAYQPDDLSKRTADQLGNWAKDASRLIATSTGVATLALADVVGGVEAACPQSVEGLVREAGGSVSAEAAVVTGSIATARSVDDVVTLFRLLSQQWFSG